MKRIMIAVALITVLGALAAVAGPVATPIRQPATVVPLDADRTTPSCLVGNDAVPYWVVDFVTPPQKFALIFDASDNTCAACPLGFRVLDIHVLLNTDGPCEYTMETILMTVTGVPGQCYAPAAAYCGSQDFVVAIPEAGLWDVSLPVVCACADSDYPFALKVEFSSACTEGGVPALVTDDAPVGCRNYVLGTDGWEDLVQVHGFPGNLVTWAEADCCGNPVGAETSSWGEIKAIYR